MQEFIVLLSQPSLYLLPVLAVAVLIAFIVTIKVFRDKVRAQNTQLIKLYLDKLFIINILQRMTCTGVVVDGKLSYVIQKIKEYFHLDDIVIYNNKKVKGIDQDRNSTYKRSLIIQHITRHIDDIVETLQNDECLLQQVQVDTYDVVLYIIPTYHGNHESFVALVQYGAPPLAKSEIDMLRDVVTCTLPSLLTSISTNK